MIPWIYTQNSYSAIIMAWKKLACESIDSDAYRSGSLPYYWYEASSPNQVSQSKYAASFAVQQSSIHVNSYPLRMI